MTTKRAKTYPPIGEVTSPTLDTNSAAYYLNRKPQTLRGWSCTKDGPIEPIRVHGRLAWRTAELRGLLGM